jgi:TetR/AcrR family transcriptional regulator
MRGDFLNCRFAVNGIQKALRSFGTGLVRSRAMAALPIWTRVRAAGCRYFLFDQTVKTTLAEALCQSTGQGGHRRIVRERAPENKADDAATGSDARAMGRRCNDRADPAPQGGRKMDGDTDKPRTRIQIRNREAILEAALEVFSQHGFRGATVDMIAAEAGLSKPNLLYYFPSKEDIHVTLLSQLLDSWLARSAPSTRRGSRCEEILAYVRRKLEMSRDFPRESRLFANEILQGAPNRAVPAKRSARAGRRQGRADRGLGGAGRIAAVEPRHLIISIWATTQHYADFEAQIGALVPEGDVWVDAAAHLETMFGKMLAPGGG